jgi:endonuclease III
MIDFNSILNNDSVKSLIKKTGIPDDKVQAVIQQAASTISKKSVENPKQCASLLSPNKNTDADNKLAQAMDSEFVSNLIKKVGLPESTAKSLQGMMPQLTQQVSQAISKNGFDLQAIVKSFSGNSKGNDLFSSISKMAGSFFGKK